MRNAFLFGGAWRIRTAVDGFADRRLSHSSKAPCFFASAKVMILSEIAKHSRLFLVATTGIEPVFHA